MTYQILVIDDEQSVRDAYTLALMEEADLRVEVAAEGDTGIAKAREIRPDLIFLDLNMPGLSGVEVLRKLLAEDPTLRVYIVTAFHKTFMTELQAARDAGLVFDLARKPLNGDQIRIIVRSVLEGGTLDLCTLET